MDKNSSLDKNEESKEADRDSEKKLVNQDNMVVVEHWDQSLLWIELILFVLLLNISVLNTC